MASVFAKSAFGVRFVLAVAPEERSDLDFVGRH